MKQLFSVILLTLAISCAEISSKETDGKNKSVDKEIVEQGSPRVLFIVSNQHTYGDSDINTANHFAEIVLAYDVFKKSGFEVDFVSPRGGAIPIGYLNTSDPIEKRYLYDFGFMKKLKTTMKPDEINPQQYQAVYYGGGGAAMFGVPEDESIQEIAMKIYNEQNGVVSAICHGTAGIVNLKTHDGEFLYSDKEVNGFPDLFENKDARYYQEFPFSIEETIKERGGNFRYSEEGWDNFFVVDGRLITGQDPTAAASVAEEVVKALKIE
ncbi:type 1 glutamine amidotransferase domain-containing protein [Allomuricauda sp. d1]|uniref:type 1 glutamine amidotransferase domain-containing protein n=1 Tax=Allomuricauda sp. d1 TaxID=3136725 RepID=UPI0031D592D9